MKRFVYPVAGVLVTAVVAFGLYMANDLDRPLLGYGAVLVACAAGLCLLGYAVGRREDALVETSMTDALTNIGNRRMFDLYLAREAARAADSGMPLAVLAVDLDDLKGHNDRDGHDAGDRALKALGAVLAATCRSRDLAARLGGDEFAVIMPRSTAREAAVLGERVRAELRARTPGVTASLGAADLHQVGAREPAALLAAADRALYAAKRAGRDRLVVLAADEARARGGAGVRCAGDDALPARACAFGASATACAMDLGRAAQADAPAPLALEPGATVTELRGRGARPGRPAARRAAKEAGPPRSARR